MCNTDPLADMLTRIRNGQSAGKKAVSMPSSKLKLSVCSVLREEGYIVDFDVVDSGSKKDLNIHLKYYKSSPVIESITKISKPGRRVYKSKTELPMVLGGLGIAIISTPKGVMSDRLAREYGFGGEVLCSVS
jgi:small subunit ribosomal protein S8